MKSTEDKCPEFLGRNGTGKNNYGTPDWLFKYLDKCFDFTLDPCADDVNHKCKKYYTEADNGLFQDWFNERVYLNPPYGNELRKWVAKSAETPASKSWRLSFYNVFGFNLKTLRNDRHIETIYDFKIDGSLVVAVIPARTCTIYFHKHIFDNPNVGDNIFYRDGLDVKNENWWLAQTWKEIQTVVQNQHPEMIIKDNSK